MIVVVANMFERWTRRHRTQDEEERRTTERRRDWDQRQVHDEITELEARVDALVRARQVRQRLAGDRDDN